MKKFSAILLTFMFMLYLGGMHVMYLMKIDDAKSVAYHHIKKNMDKGEVSQFIFSTKDFNDLKWTDKDKEFTLNNERYDIVNISYSGSQVTVVCYKDGKETEIVQALDNLFERLFSPSQQSKNTENDFASKICKEYLPVDHIHLQETITLAFSQIPQERTIASSSPIDDIWHPPAIC
jgi:hypothetical protein